MAKNKTSGKVSKKSKVGKPKRKFTDLEIEIMEDMAFHGCQNGTIAIYLDIPATTINDRLDIRKLLTKKRAERKYELHKAQDKKAMSGDTGMLCFLGKNELGQADKREITGADGGPIQISIVDFAKIKPDDTK